MQYRCTCDRVEGQAHACEVHYPLTHEVIETGMNGSRKVIGKFESFADAKAYVETLGVSHMEDDADYEGCADALLTDGRVIAIQPVGFKL